MCRVQARIQCWDLTSCSILILQTKMGETDRQTQRERAQAWAGLKARRNSAEDVSEEFMKWVAQLHGAPAVGHALCWALGRGYKDKSASLFCSQGTYKRKFRAIPSG